MTGSEMVTAFKVYYDFVTSFSAPGYEASEILLLLNNAQDDFIKDRVFGKNFQPPAFEDNIKRVADLFPLVRYEEVTSGISLIGKYGAKSWAVQKSEIGKSGGVSKLLYVFGVDARITRTNPTVTTEYFPCERIKSENIGRFVSSTVNKTFFIKPKFFESQSISPSSIIVIGDSYTSTMDRVKVNMILKPHPITEIMEEYDGTYSATKMNFEPSVHQEIVDIAVRHALQISQDPRWQSQIQEQAIKSE